jgi:hypothetical protein
MARAPPSTDPYKPPPASFMRKKVLELLQEHQQEGTLPTNGRFLFYECVTRGDIPKKMPENRTRASDDTSYLVTNALVYLREQEIIPWGWIIDETRNLESYIDPSDLKQHLLDNLDRRIDPWKGNPPLVLVESRSLVGALRDTCSHYGVRLASTNGQAGGFLHTDIIPLLKSDLEPHILYFGDWDFSGGKIEDNTRRVLEQDVGTLKWERLALTEKQVKQYKLTVIEKEDKRFNPPQFFDAVETEALSQRLIVKILKQKLDKLLPEPLAVVELRAEKQREVLRDLIEEFELPRR